MEALRYFKKAHVLRVAASELKGTLPLMKVSDYLTWIAEVVLDHVVDVAFSNLISRHGYPRRADGSACDTDFAIIGYGKLDRKSTRLNSSHVRISYAVFCLKKKKTI